MRISKINKTTMFQEGKTFKELGLDKNATFVVKNEHRHDGFSCGDLIKLISDDNTDCPKFIRLSDNFTGDCHLYCLEYAQRTIDDVQMNDLITYNGRIFRKVLGVGEPNGELTLVNLSLLDNNKDGRMLKISGANHTIFQLRRDNWTLYQEPAKHSQEAIDNALKVLEEADKIKDGKVII